MAYTGREKTNSITHLVKIVAKEVFEEEIRGRSDIHSLRETGLTFCNSIKTTLEKAGRLWSKEEDDLLSIEFSDAIAQMARNHKRSLNAIVARIRDKQLLY